MNAAAAAAAAGDDGGELQRKQQRPLVRKTNIPASIIVPYRLLIFARVVLLGLYLSWRIKTKNEDAIWLWGMSIICEAWFACSWLLEQLPKLCPVKRIADLAVLKESFESPRLNNPLGISNLPGIDVFVTAADPHEEPPLVMANTLLSVLAADYPAEKLACYLSDDTASLLTFEAVAEVAAFAAVWVPFCRKHDVEPRAPGSYFGLTKDPYHNKVRRDFVSDRRTVKREYEGFKIRINALPDSIRRRSDAWNALKQRKAVQGLRELYDDEPPLERPEDPRATWMANGCHWPGTWIHPCPQHSHGDHSAIVQMMLKPQRNVLAMGKNEENRSSSIDQAGLDTRLPTLVYVAREKRPGYEDNKKAGAMNALVRASAVISNGPFVLDLDYDNYVCNSAAFRECMCFMMDGGGERTCFVQFPPRFEGVDSSDRYGSLNNVYFDVNMRALDGIQGPVYLGSGCLFRRIALYGFDPPLPQPRGLFGSKTPAIVDSDEENQKHFATYTKRFGNSSSFVDSIPVAEFGSRPLSDHPKVDHRRLPGPLVATHSPVAPCNVTEAMSVIACSYEDKTQWGERVGWIYGSSAEDVVTGYRMHNRGWQSVYCVPAAGGRDAFRGIAPIDLAGRLRQLLLRAAGSVEFFFSRNNAMLVSPGMKAMQRAAYLNLSVYPFTSIFLTTYCFIPALCLFSGQFIVQTVSTTFLSYVLILTVTLCVHVMLEIKWSGVHLVDWWRNEQLWVMGNTSAHLAALFQGTLKAMAGIDLLDGDVRNSADGEDDEFSDLYAVRWTWLMIPPISIMMVNLVAMAVGVSRTIYSSSPEWSKFLGGLFLSLWVLMHLYPFAKGMMGKKGKTPTVVFVWSGLIAITISLLWSVIKSPSGNGNGGIGGSSSFT